MYLLFMLCMHHLSLCLSLLKVSFYQDKFEVPE